VAIESALRTDSGHSSFRERQSVSKDLYRRGLCRSKTRRLSSHAWGSKPLVVLGALSLALVPICRSGSARPIALSDQSASAPQEPDPQVPSPAGANTAERAATKRLEINYQDGQLTIIAENASLSDIMKALRTATKMDIDLPQSGAEQHIWVNLGPGPARLVLRQLLDSTELNYVIQAAENEEDGIRSVTLTPRINSPGPTGNSPMGERAASRGIQFNGSRNNPADSENAANAESVAAPASAPSESAESAAPVASAPADETMPAPNPRAVAANQQNGVGSSGGGMSGSGSPTTEQMIQQLQSMYQQRRQIQIQQNQRPQGQNQ
jgi:hypothetical protein